MLDSGDDKCAPISGLKVQLSTFEQFEPLTRILIRGVRGAYKVNLQVCTARGMNSTAVYCVQTQHVHIPA